MKIVIDISNYDAEWISNAYYIPNEINSKVANAIITGTPLPKNHGRLIILSEDVVEREKTPLSFSCQNWINEVGLSNATVAIIEAESEDKK